MKAVIIRTFGNRSVLEYAEVPEPTPGPGEVLIKVKAVGVNPVDWKIREGLLKERLPHQFPIILGWDAAGVIEDCGEGVQKFRRGDEVFAYCRKPAVKDGTYAEYVVVPSTSVALKPTRASFEEAGSIPLAGLTAYQSLFDTAGLKTGETVLVHAAGGGVGSFAVQLAKIRGAKVIGTGRAQNHSYLKELGCDFCVDYTAGDLRSGVHPIAPNGVDVVFDCLGETAVEQSFEVMRPGGRIVSILRADLRETEMPNGIKFFYVFVQPNGEELSQLASFFDEGRLKVHIAARFALKDAVKAQEMIEEKHTRGKIVLGM